MGTELTTIDQLKTKLDKKEYREKFIDILGEKKANGFISNIISITSNNALLAKAEPMSIISAAMVAATLDLSINPAIGQAAIVPYGNQATFQIMRNGLVDLSMRSGQFRSIVNEEVHEGELIKKNKFTGEYVFDEDSKTSDKVIGFMASFELLNGFRKTLYMSVEECNHHGKRYSQTFKKGFGLWSTDFESMAKKTVLKLLLSKYAPKSIEMQKALEFDQSAIVDDKPQYIDNQDNFGSVEEIDYESNFEKVKSDPVAAKLAYTKGEITEEQYNNINGDGK